jgi:hypothetical protein
MTNKEKVEYLKQYRVLLLELKVLEQKSDTLTEKYLRLRDKLQNPGCGAQTLSDVPVSHTVSNQIEKDYIQLDDIGKRLEAYSRKEAQKVLDIINKREEIENTINTLHNETYKAILTLWYVKGMKRENIAVTLNYNWKYLHRLHWRAIEQVNI